MNSADKNLKLSIADFNSRTLVSFLDMARWIAAAVVFTSHLRDPLFLGYPDIPIAERTWCVKAWYFLTGLHAEAVVVFFVLSGFLVGARGILRVHSGKFNSGSYAIDRVSRLYVTFLPALFLSYIFDLIGSNYLQAVGFWDHSHPMIAQKIISAPFQSMLSNGTIMGNVFMLQEIIVEPLGSNRPLWSISFEFWFYVAFLLAAESISLSASRIRHAIFGILLFILCLSLGSDFIIYMGLWLIGASLALLQVKRARHPIVATSIFVSVLIGARFINSQIDSSDILRNIKNYFVALSFAWLIASLCGRHYLWLDRMSGFNSFLAGFSFSLYLLHFPIMLFVLAAMYSTGLFPTIATGFNPTDATGIYIYIFVIAVIYLFAWFFSVITERNTGRVRHFFKNLS